MAVTFPFKRERTFLFKTIKRPFAEVSFKHKTEDLWRKFSLLVDTGADYTLLPQFLAPILGIDIKKDCKKINTNGVGGSSQVYMLKGKIKVRLGEYEKKIPLGFLDNDFVPPLMGRQEFFETFKVTFEDFTVRFE